MSGSTADVVVVGGGIEGGHGLALAGRGVGDVVVCERDTVGSGGTGTPETSAPGATRTIVSDLVSRLRSPTPRRRRRDALRAPSGVPTWRPSGGISGVPLLVVHLAAVFFLVGLIWVVQVLVYPGFAAVGDAPGWREHHDRHTRRVGWLVSGPWAVQGVSCALLLVARPDGVPFWLAALAAVCGLATVVVTVTLSVPCHRRLSQAYDAAVLRRLVVTNSYRTAAWTLAGAVAIAMVVLGAP